MLRSWKIAFPASQLMHQRTMSAPAPAQRKIAVSEDQTSSLATTHVGHDAQRLHIRHLIDVSQYLQLSCILVGVAVVVAAHESHPAQPVHLEHFQSLSQKEHLYESQLGHTLQFLIVPQSEALHELQVQLTAMVVVAVVVVAVMVVAFVAVAFVVVAVVVVAVVVVAVAVVVVVLGQADDDDCEEQQAWPVVSPVLLQS